MSAKKIAIIAGEPSGDILGAALMAAIKSASSEPIHFIGVGGSEMAKAGILSFFPMDDIAVMGFTAVIQRLPKILSHMRATTQRLIEERPDVLVIIDSPDFTHRVARKVRAALPDTKVVNYVCPSVWAWRQHRAKEMATFIDHVLAILPFEPQALKELNGPQATYVGHPLTEKICQPRMIEAGTKKTLLILPGSRTSEFSRLLDPFHAAVGHLKKSMPDLEVVLPTVPKHKAAIQTLTKDWAHEVQIISDRREKEQAFCRAHAALTASGTVCLELAVYGVPMISTYKLDFIGRQLKSRVKIWTANLPNLIVGYPAVPEFIDEMVRPELLARSVDRLLKDTPQRAAQCAAFEEMASILAADAATTFNGQQKTPAERSAEVVLSYL